jgi:hypothetical protein
MKPLIPPLKSNPRFILLYIIYLALLLMFGSLIGLRIITLNSYGEFAPLGTRLESCATMEQFYMSEYRTAVVWHWLFNNCFPLSMLL